jgi:hypothetical protein
MGLQFGGRLERLPRPVGPWPWVWIPFISPHLLPEGFRLTREQAALYSLDAVRLVAEEPVMADQMPATAGRGHLRASHADREQVIGTLKAAFVQGMLAKDEFDARVGQAFGSATYAELAALTADLPAMPPAAQSPKPSRPQGKQPVLRPSRWMGVATAAYAGAWAYELFLSPHGGDNPWFPPLIIGGFLIYLGILIASVGEIIVNRQDKRSGRQPPRRPAPGASR